MAASASEGRVFAVRAPIARADLPGLYERACTELQADADGVIVCDVTGLAADAVAVEALARLQLGARRGGCRVCLSNASPELVELVAFVGLRDVLPCDR
jgi:ABC-type transporter Mla MlaB component